MKRWGLYLSLKGFPSEVWMPPFAVKRMGGNCVRVDGPVTQKPGAPEGAPHTVAIAVRRVREYGRASFGTARFMSEYRPSNLITNES